MPRIYSARWQVLYGQTSDQFIYPTLSTAVGATHTSGGQLIAAGPFPAKLGSTWEITQESINAAAVLRQKYNEFVHSILHSFN